jgi:hypothetical protein
MDLCGAELDWMGWLRYVPKLDGLNEVYTGSVWSRLGWLRCVQELLGAVWGSVELG